MMLNVPCGEHFGPDARRLVYKDWCARQKVLCCAISVKSSSPPASTQGLSQEEEAKLKENFMKKVQAKQKKIKEETVFVLTGKPSRMAAAEEVVKRHERDKIFQQELMKEDNKMKVPENHRSGYVALVGKPNAGKSTLLNAIIGQKLAIVTEKPQTTRHRILGISSGPEYQMILYDTPGIITKKQHKLDQLMMKNVRSASGNADCLVLLVDISHDTEHILRNLDDKSAHFISNKPTLLVLNKMDIVNTKEQREKIEWYEKNSGMDKVIAVSAKYGIGVDEVKEWLISRMPLGPAYFPRDYVSEHQERFFVAELVREKIFQLFQQEVPYSTQVNVLSFIERKPPAKDFIKVEILVERESQKGILLGKKGQALKQLSTAARLDIEDFVERKVYLEIKVEVRPGWRKDEQLLKSVGYDANLPRGLEDLSKIFPNFPRISQDF